MGEVNRVMDYRFWSRKLACVLLSAACLLAPQAHARETLVWLLRDLPPLTIFEGPQKGQGAVDQLLPLLMASLPEYEHSILRVNRARAMQMLHEPGFACDPALLWTAERAKTITYSIPSMGMNSNGLIVRDQDSALLNPFTHQGEVDLGALLAKGDLKLGIIAERSYGTQIDSVLKHAPAEQLTAHYGNDALGSLLQMQRLDRLKLLLGYWPEVRYQASQQGIALQELRFYPVEGNAKYQFIHVACSNTAQGHAAISRINETLRNLRHERLPGFYAAWLDPKMHGEYLEDAKGFFQNPQDQ